MSTFIQARQDAFDTAAKALLEGRDEEINPVDDPATRDIVGAICHIKERYADREDRRGKLIIVAAVEGLNAAVVEETALE